MSSSGNAQVLDLKKFKDNYNRQELIDNDKIDDLISDLRLRGFSDRADKIVDLYKEYSEEFNSTYHDMFETYSYIGKYCNPQNRKEFAMIVNKHYKPYQNILFNVLDGEDAFILKNIKKFILYKLTEKYKGQTLFMGGF